MNIFYIYRKYPAICCCALQFLSMETQIINTLIGLALLIAAIIKSRKKSSLINWGIKSEGIIYSVERSIRDKAYYPVVQVQNRGAVMDHQKAGFWNHPLPICQRKQSELNP